MKKSKTDRSLRRTVGIRQHMMLFLVAFICFVLALLWICQILLLDDFYRYYKTQQLKSAADAIVRNIDHEDVAALAEQLAGQNELCIVVLNEAMEPQLSAEGQRFCLIHKMRSLTLAWWCAKAPEDGSARLELFDISPFPALHYDANRYEGRVPPKQDSDESKSLLYARRITLADGSNGYLLLNAVITPVSATVSTLRSQLTLITVVVLVGAVLLAALLSRNFSRPIIETSENARALARGAYVRPPRANSYREISELNDTLEKAAAELSQVDHLQHELIANISHDLRTPLTMIGGYAEVMRDIPSEITPENMQAIIDETKRLSSLVNELLDFSRLESGMAKLTPAPFCLTDTVSAMVARCAALTGPDGYTIAFAPGERLWVTADEARIEQVVYNLLNNALTYTGTDKTVRLVQQRVDSRVRLEIHDSGKGIPEEELPLIWNRYYRAKESHKRAIQGSGLGLSIVRTILESHGARYGVTSRDGEGTCFWFELEAAEPLDA